MDWIPVFKAGTHTDSAGNTREWTQGDLDHIVSSYDPTNGHEAPVVIGHPTDNAPAWGWVEALKRTGEILYAKPKSLIPEFVEMVKKGLFKKRSISLYPDMTLRHIGFLGAMPPAVKGLPDVAFKDQQGQAVEYVNAFDQADPTDLSDPTNKEQTKKEGAMPKIAELWQQFVEFMKGKGVEIDESPPAGADIQRRIAEGIEAGMKPVREKLAADFAEQKQALDAQAAKIKDAENRARKTEIASFCETIQKQGKVTPAQAKVGMGLSAFCEQLARYDMPVEFGEGDGKGTQTLFEFFSGFCKTLPNQITFREVAGGSHRVTGGAGEKMETLIKERMKADRTLTYTVAFGEVQKENPELAAEYADSIGE